MVITLTKVSTASDLNDPDVFESGLSGTTYAIVATGGNYLRPFPRQLNKGSASVSITGTNTLVLPIHMADFHRKPVDGLSEDMASELNYGIQAGLYTSSIATQSGSRDQFDKFTAAVV